MRSDIPSESNRVDLPPILCACAGLLTVLITFLIIYLNHEVLPSSRTALPNGWFLWWDQGQYYKTAIDLSNANILPSSYWHGYPALGAIFIKLLPAHPFLPSTVIGIAALYLSLYTALRNFASNPESAGISAVLLVTPLAIFRTSFVEPWNTLPPHVTFSFLAAALIFRKPTLAACTVGSLLTAYTITCRPSDALFLSILWLGGALNLSAYRAKLTALSVHFAACCLAIAVLITINLITYGSWSSPYISNSGGNFNWSDIPFRAYQLFIDGTVLSGESSLPVGTVMSSFLGLCPWLVFALPGLYSAFPLFGARLWWFIASSTTYVVFYLGFNFVANPGHFWSYSLYHYCAVLVPWFGFFSYIGVRNAHTMKLRRFLPLASILPIAILSFSLDATIVWSARPSTETGQIIPDAPFAGSASISVEDSHAIFAANFATPVRFRTVRFFCAEITNTNYTIADAAKTIRFAINGSKLDVWKDFVVSQDGRCISISLVSPRFLSTEVSTVDVTFETRPAKHIWRVDLLRPRWAPGTSYARIFDQLRGHLRHTAPQYTVKLAPPYTIHFGPTGTGSTLLKSGWGFAENGEYTWSEGESSISRFALDERCPSCIVTLRGTTFGKQRSLILCNGKLIGEIDADYFDHQFEVSFSTSAVPQNPDRTFEIEFVNLTARSPFSIGMNSDKRVLAIALREFSLTTPLQPD